MIMEKNEARCRIVEQRAPDRGQIVIEYWLDGRHDTKSREVIAKKVAFRLGERLSRRQKFHLNRTPRQLDARSSRCNRRRSEIEKLLKRQTGDCPLEDCQ